MSHPLSDIYLVWGSTGRYHFEDHQKWLVGAFRSATLAWDLREKSEKSARELFVWRSPKGEIWPAVFKYGDSKEVPRNPHDPKMVIAFSAYDHDRIEPVRYSVEVIKLDER